MSTDTGRRRILIVTRHFPPTNNAGVHRLMGMARYLPEFGYEPLVLTTVAGNGFQDPGLLASLPEGLEVHRTAMPRLRGDHDDHRPSILTRIRRALAWRIEKWLMPVDAHFLWIFPAILRARRLLREHSVDTVLISSPPHSSHLIGLALGRRRVPFLINDFRDAWAHNPYYRQGLEKRGPLARFWESRVLGRSDLIVANTPTNKRLLMEDYGIADDKICVIPNGFNDHREPSVSEGDKDSGVMTMVYTGELYEGMGEHVMAALGELKRRHPDLARRFRVVFVGLLYDEDLQLIKEHDLEDVVEYRGYVSYAESQELVMSSDLCLFLLPNSPKVDNWIPSKLYFYLGQRKTVLAVIPPGDAANVIETTRAGYVFEPNQEAEVTRLLEQFVFEDRPLAMHYDEQAWLKYSRREQVRDLAARLDSLTQRHA